MGVNKDNRMRNVFCTLNLGGVGCSGFTITPEELFASKHVAYAIRSGRELAPTTGQVHYHYYLELTVKQSLLQIKKLFRNNRVNVQARLHTAKECIAYMKPDYYSKKHQKIKKDYTSDASSPWLEAGAPKAQGKRNDWCTVYDQIHDLSLPMSDIFEQHKEKSIIYRKCMRQARADARYEHFNGMAIDRECHIWYGDEGTGKDTDVFRKYGSKNVYELCKDDNKAVWWDGYRGQDVLLISDFDGSQLSRSRLLNILGGRMVRVNIKGFTDWWSGTKVVITSNTHPDTWYENDFSLDPAFCSRITGMKWYVHSDTTQRIGLPECETIARPNYRKRARKKARNRKTAPISPVLPDRRLLGTVQEGPIIMQPNVNGSIRPPHRSTKIS